MKIVLDITADNINGFFANAETTVSFSGGMFDVNYSGTEVVLSNFQVPEPGSMALILGALSMLILRRRR